MSAIRETGLGGKGNETSYSKRNFGGDCGGGCATEATVTMRHLLAAATVSAARPGVTADMIAGYDRFASGL